MSSDAPEAPVQADDASLTPTSYLSVDSAEPVHVDAAPDELVDKLTTALKKGTVASFALVGGGTLLLSGQRLTSAVVTQYVGPQKHIGM